MASQVRDYKTLLTADGAWHGRNVLEANREAMSESLAKLREQEPFIHSAIVWGYAQS